MPARDRGAAQPRVNLFRLNGTFERHVIGEELTQEFIAIAFALGSAPAMAQFLKLAQPRGIDRCGECRQCPHWRSFSGCSMREFRR